MTFPVAANVANLNLKFSNWDSHWEFFDVEHGKRLSHTRRTDPSSILHTSLLSFPNNILEQRDTWTRSFLDVPNWNEQCSSNTHSRKNVFYFLNLCIVAKKFQILTFDQRRTPFAVHCGRRKQIGIASTLRLGYWWIRSDFWELLSWEGPNFKGILRILFCRFG